MTTIKIIDTETGETTISTVYEGAEAMARIEAIIAACEARAAQEGEEA